MKALRPSLAPAVAFLAFAPLVACTTPGEGEGEPAVAYNPTVGNILNHNCVSCHQEGGIGPFSLATYDDAKGVAELLPVVTEERLMPPWGMDETGECNNFHDARVLTDDEIATLAAWAEAGAPEGDPASPPDAPDALPALESVDAVLDPGAEYTPDQTRDDYRCLPVETGTDVAGKFLTGYEVRPGAPEIVHHVILYRVPASASATVDNLDANEAGPGYTCFGAARTGGQEEVFVAWAPGIGATNYPEGTGLRLASGDRLVMQVHYNPTMATGQSDRTTIDLKLADSVAEEAFIDLWFDPTMQLPAGKERHWHDYTGNVPTDVKLYGVFPHMHELGREMEIFATAPGISMCLSKTPRYDFNWQQFYFYEEPIELSSTARLSINCGYDTRSREGTTYFGEATSDEMCVVGFYYTLR